MNRRVVIQECSECGQTGPCYLAAIDGDTVAICQNVQECENRIEYNDRQELYAEQWETAAEYRTFEYERFLSAMGH